MNPRELFLNILSFRKVERNLKWDFGYWGGTLLRWQQEGLPRDLEYLGPKREMVYGEFINGPGVPYPMPSYDEDVLYASGMSRLFGLDAGMAPFPFNWWYFPRFEKRVIEEAEETIEYVDTLGIRRMDFKDQRSMPKWLGYPVKDEKDWEKLKEERLNLDSFEKRYTVPDRNGYLSAVRKRDFPLLLYGSPIGFFGILRFMIGEPNIYYWYYDNPSLLKRMAEHLCTMWLSIAEELTAAVNFDVCYFFEDMAYKGGSLISGDLFKEFMHPYYSRLIGFARSKGVEHHIVDCDGYVEELLPLFMDAGLTGCQPFEVRAGNDIERVRARFPRLEILGGIDKTALQSRESTDRELAKVQRMVKKGGYIPYVDHAYPPDISYDSYRYFRERLNRVVEQRPSSA
jgi:hypothetical protein